MQQYETSLMLAQESNDSPSACAGVARLVWPLGREFRATANDQENAAVVAPAQVRRTEASPGPGVCLAK